MAAIVDWEMATIGDPLLDSPGSSWGESESRRGPLRGRLRRLHRHAVPRGAARALCPGLRLPVDEMDYYVILRRFKLAIVLEAGYALRQGGADNPKIALFGDVVLDLARKAGALARETRL